MLPSLLWEYGAARFNNSLRQLLSASSWLPDPELFRQPLFHHQTPGHQPAVKSHTLNTPFWMSDLPERCSVGKVCTTFGGALVLLLESSLLGKGDWWTEYHWVHFWLCRQAGAWQMSAEWLRQLILCKVNRKNLGYTWHWLNSYPSLKEIFGLKVWQAPVVWALLLKDQIMFNL